MDDETPEPIGLLPVSSGGPVNHTLIHYADPSEQISHDAINRFFGQEKMTSGLIWEHVRADVVPSEKGYVIFDDTTFEIFDKNLSHKLELVRRQYSGNAQGMLKRV